MPASRSSRRASRREASMSFPKPAIVTSSASEVAKGLPGGRVLDEERAEAVEVRAALDEVVVVLLAEDVGASHVLDELEGATAEHVVLVPVRIARQDVGLVDEVEGRGEVGEHRHRRPLELEDDRPRIGASTRSTTPY